LFTVVVGVLVGVLTNLITPDGSWGVAGNLDGTLTRWDVRSGRTTMTIDFGAGLHAVDVAPNGRTVAAAGEDGVLAVVTDGGDQVKLIPPPDASHKGRWDAVASGPTTRAQPRRAETRLLRPRRRRPRLEHPRLRGGREAGDSR
jgi:WD40 repeat protein